jgi:hypothetical protein
MKFLTSSKAARACPDRPAGAGAPLAIASAA